MPYTDPQPTETAPLNLYSPQPMATYQPALMTPVEGRRVVGYERYGGDLMVPVYEAPPAPVLPATIVVRHGVDPVAQRVFAAGVSAGAAGAGIGWGVGEALAGIATIGGAASLAVIAAFLLLARMGGGRTTNIHNESHVHQQNRWFGRSNSTTNQG